MRTHQIHAFTKHSKDAIRHLAFKEYLKANPLIAKQYSKLKKRVAKQSNGSMERYCEGKNDFIKEHEERALVWFSINKS